MLAEFQAAQFSEVRFQYPSTCTCETVADTPEGLLVRLSPVHEGCASGQLLIEAYRGRSSSLFHHVARTFAARLQNAGIRLGGAPLLPAVPAPGFVAAKSYAPPAHSADAKFDVVLLVNQTAAHTIGLGCCIARREFSPAAWEANRQVFETVHHSLVVEPQG